MEPLSITVGDNTLAAMWSDQNPTTRQAVADALPLSGDATRWGDELYFRTPVDVATEDAQTEVPVGAVAYWPQGNALCLFWGPTPASRDKEPRAAAPVNVIAMLEDTTPLHQLDGGARIQIDHANE